MRVGAGLTVACLTVAGFSSTAKSSSSSKTITAPTTAVAATRQRRPQPHRRPQQLRSRHLQLQHFHRLLHLALHPQRRPHLHVLDLETAIRYRAAGIATGQASSVPPQTAVRAASLQTARRSPVDQVAMAIGGKPHEPLALWKQVITWVVAAIVVLGWHRRWEDSLWRRSISAGLNTCGALSITAGRWPGRSVAPA
jgi:hypothetical protein